MKRIESNRAPKAVGPYSQAIQTESNKLLFVSGQIPLDPDTGQMVEGDIRRMTHRVIDNIEAILKEGGSSLDHVVKVEVFLTDMADFKLVNEEYSKRFNKTRPARAAIQAAALPLGARIEMSCIAVMP